MVKVIMGLKNTTTILISHRLSTVRDADCIYLVDNGEIIESGTHDELMRKNGKYAAMWNMQAEKYLNGGHNHEEMSRLRYGHCQSGYQMP